MNFEPVRTKADLDSLNHDEVVEGFMDGYRDPDQPEPGVNRGRAYWHGWRNAMIDLRKLPMDAASHQLAQELWPRGIYKG